MIYVCTFIIHQLVLGKKIFWRLKLKKICTLSLSLYKVSLTHSLSLSFTHTHTLFVTHALTRKEGRQGGWIQSWSMQMHFFKKWMNFVHFRQHTKPPQFNFQVQVGTYFRVTRKIFNSSSDTSWNLMNKMRSYFPKVN